MGSHKNGVQTHILAEIDFVFPASDHNHHNRIFD